MVSLHYLAYEVSSFKGNGVYVRTGLAWVRDLEWYGNGLGALQNLVFGSSSLMVCPKSSVGYLYDYDSEKEILTFTP